MIIIFVIITNDCGDCSYLDDYNCRDCRDDRDTELSEDIFFLVFDNSTGCPKKRVNNKTNKNGQTWQACQHSKVVQKGSKIST